MFEEFEQAINYSYKDKDILKKAFTHSSYAYEKKYEAWKSNERLEFLGDAVLELVISNYLYRNYQEDLEGDLTKLRASVVCEPTLAANARALKMGDFLLLGKGEEQTGGRARDSILADTFEAVIGSVYIDGGFESAEKFILDNLKDDIINMEGSYQDIDYKTNLQEYYQKFSKEPLKYNIISEDGPDHNKTFTARLTHRHDILGAGKGKSKKEAEQKAAYEALKKIQDKG
jgi:ribonuclease-3